MSNSITINVVPHGLFPGTITAKASIFYEVGYKNTKIGSAKVAKCPAGILTGFDSDHSCSFKVVIDAEVPEAGKDFDFLFTGYIPEVNTATSLAFATSFFPK